MEEQGTGQEGLAQAQDMEREAGGESPQVGAGSPVAPAEQLQDAAQESEWDDWIEQEMAREGAGDASASLPSSILAGAVGGFVATLPMTVMMLLFKLKLPWWQRYALPPYQITTKALEGLGLKQQTNMPQRHLLSLIMHFGYGAGLGAVYGPLSRPLPAPGVVKGAAYGLLVWVVSYMGWLPVFNVRRSGAEQPQERRLLMIAAHLIWGAVTALVAARIAQEKE